MSRDAGLHKAHCSGREIHTVEEKTCDKPRFLNYSSAVTGIHLVFFALFLGLKYVLEVMVWCMHARIRMKQRSDDTRRRVGIMLIFCSICMQHSR